MVLLPQSLNDLDYYIEDPFFLFEKENFLDEALYWQLYDNFPGDSYFKKSYYGRGNKAHLENTSQDFSEFIKSNECWRNFYEEFSSPKILTQIFNLWSLADIPPERNLHYRNPWLYSAYKTKYKRKAQKLLLRLIRRNSVRLGFEFSSIPLNGYIPPHTDVAKKLMSFLIYFPDKDIDYKGSYGTSFFRANNNVKPVHSWHSNLLKENDSSLFYKSHNEFYRSEFTPNKLIGFVKTSLSWHSVEPLKIQGTTRRSLCINLFTK
jgi:hypothetical protein